MHACLRDYSTHVFRARRQSASACRHRQCRMNAGKEPCDKTTEKNCPKSALYLVAIACASTFFLRGERTCAGAPCLVSITLARSHVGAIMPKLAREIPRLCRGGSKCLTFPAVAPQAPIDETLSVSRQAHTQSPIDGRQWESVKHGDESARCYAAFVPRYPGRNCTLSSDANQTGARRVSTSRLQAAHTLGARQRPQ